MIPHGNTTLLFIVQMYVFSLGMSVYSSADYGLSQNAQLELSDPLDQLLSAMCEEDPNFRFTLDQVLQVRFGFVFIDR